MNKINWKVRFNSKNRQFYLRLILALALLVKFVNNPYLVGLTIVNILNIIPDPTTKGFGDSADALTYDEPKYD